MRAVICTRYGPPEVLQLADVERPTPSRNQIRILGMVLSGDVESVGRNVTSFKRGDQVFGMSRCVVGTSAEEVCWSANTLLAPRPKNLSDEDAKKALASLK